jgi:hypothetical protein
MGSAFLEFLVNALASVRRDAPACAAAMARALGPTGVIVEVSGEVVAIASSPDGLAAMAIASDGVGRDPARPRLSVGARTLLELVDGEHELLPTVLANALRVRAAAADAARLFDAVRLFVEGCARSGAAVEQLSVYRAQVGMEPKGV